MRIHFAFEGYISVLEATQENFEGLRGSKKVPESDYRKIRGLIMLLAKSVADGEKIAVN